MSQKRLVGMMAAALALSVASAFAQDADDAAAKLKAKYDQQKSYYEMKNAEIDLRNKIAPKSGLTSSVDVGEDAAQAGASLLAAKELNRIARSVAGALTTTAATQTGGAVVIFSADDDPSLAHYRIFNIRYTKVVNSIDAIKPEPSGAPTILGPARAPGPTSFVSDIATFASYFAAQTKVGAANADLGEFAIQAAVAGELHGCNVYIASQVETDAAARVIEQQLADLDKKARPLPAMLAAAEKNSKDPKWKDRIDSLNTAIEAYSAFIGDLSATEKALLPLDKVIRENALSTALQGGYELFLKTSYSGGAYYSTTSLWTIIGGNPFRVSAGAVISYSLVEAATGRVLASGVIPHASDYVGVKSVARIVNAPPTPEEAKSATAALSRRLLCQKPATPPPPAQ